LSKLRINRNESTRPAGVLTSDDERDTSADTSGSRWCSGGWGVYGHRVSPWLLAT